MSLIEQIIPNPELRTPEVTKFVEEALDCCILHARKNHDYGNAFYKAMKDLGQSYAVGKLFDKMQRLIALCGKEETSEVVDESYEDTLRDMACYAIMTIVYRQYVKSKTVQV